MKLKLLTKKKKGNCIIMGAGGQAAGKSTTKKKKKSILLLWSQHTAQNTRENSSPAITQQLPLQFIKRHHIKA